MATADQPTPGQQTIVIQQRERVSWVRRVLIMGFWAIVLLALFTPYLTRDQGLPTRLSERYVAGDISSTKVAIVEVDGMIFDAQVEYVIKQLRQARADETVRAVVLRIESPGGTVSGSDQIWREIEMLKKAKKPVIASLGGIAASGGYYVAAAADYIVAEPTTITGSIGVISEFPNVSGLMDKLGVKMETIATGEWKDSGSLFRPMTEPERDRWRKMLDASYQRFTRIIAKGRNLPIEKVKALADGRVFTAEEALANKLVDEQGYLDDAILIAQSRAKLESPRVIKYARPLSFTDALLNMSAPRPAWGLAHDASLPLPAPRMMFLAR